MIDWDYERSRCWFPNTGAGVKPECHDCERARPFADLCSRCFANAMAHGDTGNIPVMVKRGYSREFRPHGDTGKRYLLDEIPAGLWSAVRDKCKREGVSIRAQILKLLKAWIEGDTGRTA